MKVGTLFTGFGGFDMGALAAGLTPVWGIEYDDDLALTDAEGACPECEGTGVVVGIRTDLSPPRDFKERCPSCGGRGFDGP